MPSETDWDLSVKAVVLLEVSSFAKGSNLGKLKILFLFYSACRIDDKSVFKGWSVK